MPFVVLNSGGFDSVVLMHLIREQYANKELYSLHFNYGQPNCVQEGEAAEKVASRLGYKHIVIKLPTFDWSNSDFFIKGVHDEEKQEVEYRNLVFISYAASFAKSVGADRVYVAFIDFEGNEYADSSWTFIRYTNNLLRKTGDIELRAPLIRYTKYELAPVALRFGINTQHFFSCNMPVDGKPCGKCADCKVLNKIYSGVFDDVRAPRIFV